MGGMIWWGVPSPLPGSIAGAFSRVARTMRGGDEMGMWVPGIEAKRGCIPSQAAPPDFLLPGPGLCAVHHPHPCPTRAPALLGCGAPSGRAPTCHRESLGPHKYPTDPASGPGPFDWAWGEPQAATSISAACSGLLRAPGAGPRACSPPACGWGFHLEPLHLEPII